MRTRQIVVALLILAGAGCTDDTREAFGLARTETRPPVTIDILCDPRAESTCTASSLQHVVARELQTAAEQPNSLVRLWTLGVTAADTTVVASVTSPTRFPRGAAGEAARATFVASSTAALLKAAEPAFNDTRTCCSPLLEAVGWIAQATPADGSSRRVVTISDGYQVSPLASFEDPTLPSERDLLSRLERNRVLSAGSLRGAELVLTGAALRPNTVGNPFRRADGVRALWAAVAARTGATFHYEVSLTGHQQGDRHVRQEH